MVKNEKVPLPREAIDKVFEEATCPPEYVVALYKLVYRDAWDTIKSVGHPVVAEATNHYIFGKAIAFDQVYNTTLEWRERIQPGGAWLSRGFTVGSNVPEWTAIPVPFEVVG